MTEDKQIFLSAEELAALAGDDDTSVESADDAEIGAQDDSDAGQDNTYQPLLQVREIPQAREALSALNDHEADLQAKFVEGDITSGELTAGLRDVQKHRNEIEWQMRKNELAQDMERTHEDAKWVSAVKSFMSREGAAIAKNEGLSIAFDQVVRKVTADASNVGLSFRKQLEKAHELFKDDIARAGVSLDDDAGYSMASGNANFTALDRLAESNPQKFEAAFAKLSAAQQQSYLES